MKRYINLVENALEKYNVPTRAIRDEVEKLSSGHSLLLYHVDELIAAKTEIGRRSHGKKIRDVMQKQTAIVHKILNLAAIEIHPPDLKTQ